MIEPTFRLPASLAGVATPPVDVPPGSTLVAVGLAPLADTGSIGATVIRAELALDGLDGGTGGGETREWFDAGTPLDLDSTTTTVVIPVAGYAAIRLAVRTAADDGDAVLGVWLGVPS